MKKVIIYYFTGTGNTRIAAQAIKKELDSSGYLTTLVECRDDNDSMLLSSKFDIVGFGYPIHAFNVPRYFMKQIKKLPPVTQKKAFIFKTSGEPFGFNRISSWGLIKILKKKGYQMLMDKHLLMPYNIMFRYQDALAKQMYLHTLRMAKVIAYDITHERKKRITFNLLQLPIMYIFRIQWFGAKLNGPLFHAKKDICTSCGICVKSCPTGNIIMKDGIPSFGKDCTMCMACVMDCPVDAIRPGLINGFRINGRYPFQKLMDDERISAEFINEKTKGYFGLFKKYYDKTNQEIDEVLSLIEEQKV